MWLRGFKYKLVGSIVLGKAETGYHGRVGTLQAAPTWC